MQFSLKAVLLLLALAIGSASYGFDLGGMLGTGTEPCGCGNGNCCDGCEPGNCFRPNCGSDAGCGCEADCGCEPNCGCEPSCGCSSSCEPACGCGSYCVDGRSFAGKTYNCGCESHVPMRGCTGPSCCAEPTCGCGCGDCCEANCGCEPSCGCSSSCEPSCGCDSGCHSGGCCSGLIHACARMCSAVCGGGSCGCNGEVYWSEWHNDPPRCCDPCNHCGQWVGPGAGCGCGGCGGGGCNSCDSCGPSGCGCNGGYSGPYDGGYGGGYGGGGDNYYSSNRPTRPHGGSTFAANQMPRKSVNASMAHSSAANGSNLAHNTANPYTKARLARKTQQGTQNPQQQQSHR